MFFFDPTYLIIMAPALILMMLAQWQVKSAYSRWSQVRNYTNINGVEAARHLIAESGLTDIQIEPARGQLSDHYDPRTKTLRLSAGVANSPSVAAVAIAAHEIGHALQDQHGYTPLKLRAALVPAVNIGSTLGWVFIFLGLLLRSALGTQLAWIGVGLFGLGAIFALATIPVEFNASSRARQLLSDSGLIYHAEERQGVNAVLNAAALTYVAALAAALSQLLYYAFLVMGIGGRRRS
jgi:Zn-dependent membrane protease YugP